MHLRKSRFSYSVRLELIFWLLIFSLFMEVTRSCGPGRSGIRPRMQKRLKPLVYKQHVPNVPEKTLGASGPIDAPIRQRGDPRFKDLVPNYNAEIIFKDEEGSGEDRLMTQRCKERVNTLAVSVMNLWPGVRLRITESWDNESIHQTDSLHYEGRAVDVTTSDRDSAKLGMLARLAIEAGFDWVYYESRSHIHCSVKSGWIHHWMSDNPNQQVLHSWDQQNYQPHFPSPHCETSQSGKSLGCFSGDTLVTLSNGTQKLMSRLEVEDRVLTLNSQGNLEYSPVLMFMHHSPQHRAMFLRIHLESGANITITPSHLILRWQRANVTSLYEAMPVYARDVNRGELLLISRHNSGRTLLVDRISDIETLYETGVYAPLTETGTIVVNDVVASCYAVVYSQRLAHFAFAPVRFYHSMQSSFTNFYNLVRDRLATGSGSTTTVTARYAPQDGIHWYCRLLYGLTKFFVPVDWMMEM